MKNNLLEVRHLKKHYPLYKGAFRRCIGHMKSVDDVSFTIASGQIVALVGESGSGKTTLGRSVIRLEEPTSGEVFFQGESLLSCSSKRLRFLRRQIPMIFQDPFASLNPRKTILENIGGPLSYHRIVKNPYDKVVSILEKIGISPQSLYQYPHQFSGGQQQRIAIGRALIMHPPLIICDEVVSALDVSVQMQILNLLRELKEAFQLSYLFISHDLSVVRYFCDDILVMYRGKIVERGPVEEVFQNPKHPYTQLLLACIPKMHPQEKKALPTFISRKPPSPEGCPFFDRCPKAESSCAFQPPPLQKEGKHHYCCIH